MKSKDFIAMIQQADPTGEAQIRLCGSGVPIAAELVEGYFDGPHHSIDENGNYLISIQGGKLDIHTIDLKEHVCDLVTAEKSWEEITKTILFEFDGYNPESIDERKHRYIGKAREAFDEITEIYVRFYQMDLERARSNAKINVKWFQNKSDNDWKIFTNEGVQLTTNKCHIEPVLKSGEWERLDNGVMEGYYQWIYKK
jgi:hypothetical protein